MRNAHAGLLVFVAAAFIAAVVGVALLWSAAPEPPAPTPGVGETLRTGTVIAIAQGADAEDADVPGLTPNARALEVTAELDGGAEVTFEMIDETGVLAVGQRVRVAESVSPDGGVVYYISDIERTRPLLILGVVFLVTVLAFGRWQGLRALIGLGLTLAVVIAFVVPAVLAGRDPVAVALAAAVVIMVVTLYLSHGASPHTTAAAVGTLIALAVTVALSWAFIEFAVLSGLSDEEARMASVSAGGISLQGLLLAGIILGALGVLDDVTMAQSSTVFELRRHDPDADLSALYGGAMSVGRDHVAATINTLFLAYAGASLPLLVLFATSPDSTSVIVSSEVVAVEIVRTLVGSIGLVVSVPVTTALAALLARSQSRQRRPQRPADDDPGGSDHKGPLAHAHRAPSGRRSVRGERDVVAVLTDDDGEQDWERRLRSSYGLREDQRGAATGDEGRT